MNNFELQWQHHLNMNLMIISFVAHGASMSNFLQINGKLSMFELVVNYAIKYLMLTCIWKLRLFMNSLPLMIICRCWIMNLIAKRMRQWIRHLQKLLPKICFFQIKVVEWSTVFGNCIWLTWLLWNDEFYFAIFDRQSKLYSKTIGEVMGYATW